MQARPGGAGAGGADALAPARGLLIGARWGALGVAVGISASVGLGREAFIATAVLAAVAVGRTVLPAAMRPGDVRDRLLLGAEVVINVAAVAFTKGWVSPFLFCVAAMGIPVGYGLGLATAAVAAIAVSAAVSLLALVVASPAEAADAVLGASQVLLVHLVAGYARRVFSDQEAMTSSALSRVERLTEANDLLFELYRVAQLLPLSLDLGDTVQVTVGRAKELLAPDVVAVLLPDEASGGWSVAAADGVRLRGSRLAEELPAGLQAASDQPDAHLEPALAGGGLDPHATSGVYAALRARGDLVGLLALERRGGTPLTERDARLVEGLAEQAALAIDNARWFRRLRTVGADEERMRIARDLHDRVGQSLAYLAFELDRLVGRVPEGPLLEELRGLRSDARRAVGEVREALYDLRTDVTDESGLADVLAQFVERVRLRSRLEVVLDVDGRDRLPLAQERELLRIAQEAVVNVERHAEATTVRISLSITPDAAVLEVVDDGRGFVHGRRRTDSYGLLGMRERADSIGATLDVESALDEGTTIRCRLPRREEEGSAT